MKKYLFGAMLVGVAFTGCVNDVETELPVKDNLKPITFEVAKYKSSSRADESAQDAGSTGMSEYSTTQKFGAFAFYASDVNGEHLPYMNEDDEPLTNAKVAYSTNVWTVISDTYFWPQTGHLDFVCYSPYAQISPVTVGHVNENAKDYNKLSFTNYQVGNDDLMYSDKAQLLTHNKTTFYKSGVPTLFRHALAKLNFKVATKYVTSDEIVDNTTKVNHWRVVVNSIKLNNIYNTGNLNLVTTPRTEAGTSQYENVNHESGQPNVWVRVGTNQTEREWTVPNGQLLTVVPTDFDSAINYYVMPQTFTEAEQSITITYTISNRIGDTGNFSTPKEATKTLYFSKYNAMVKAWEMGKNITYTILIDPKGDVINFDPAVADWEAVSGTLDI